MFRVDRFRSLTADDSIAAARDRPQRWTDASWNNAGRMGAATGFTTNRAVGGEKPSEVWFIAAVVIFALYAALFIYRTSFVVGGERYFSLFDDAMVSMRYARNLALGQGLVWNPGGERVEGFTNPLWVLYMAAVHVLPLAPSKTSLVVQITAAALLIADLFAVRRLALTVADGSIMTAWGAVALTAAYLPINNWSLQGMEVAALAPLTTVCAAMAVRVIVTREFDRRLYALLGVGTLLRPDMVVVAAAVAVFLSIVDAAHRRRHGVWAGAAVGIPIAGQTIARLWYYGALLPNTYYLKVTGVPIAIRFARGAYVFAQFVWQANPIWLLLAASTVFWRDRRMWLLLWIAAAQASYSIYVGGDAWESWGGSNRYLAIVMPLVFVLLAASLSATARALAHGPRAAAAAFVVLVACAIVSLDAIHGVGALAEALLLRPPLHSGPGGENQSDVIVALQLRQLTMADARVAVMRAGTIPYFADRPSIDLLGKNDASVAREPARLPGGWRQFRAFRPGHVKFDFAHSIGALRPDVVIALRERTALAKPYLGDRYGAFVLNGACAYARLDSPTVRWDRIRPGGCGP